MPGDDQPERVEPNASGDIDTETVIRLLAENVEITQDRTELAPTAGRVVEDAGGSLWLGDGSRWLDSATVGQSTPSLDADSLNTADLANAASGQVPKAQGDGTLSMASVGGGIWTEDGNSPLTGTGASSYTFTLADTFDIVLVQVQLQDTSGAVNRFDLQANGDAGTNYNFVRADGTSATGGTQVTEINELGGGAERTDYFIIDGRWAGAWTGGSPPPDGVASRAVGWHNGAITSPLTQLTVVGGGTFDISLSVFGHDIGPAGAP